MKIKLKSTPKLSRETPYVFYCSKADYIDFPDITKSLPPLRKKERREFIQYQNKMIDTLRDHNQNNLVFMSTPFACENLWQSDFFIGLESLFRLKQLLKKEKYISLTCSDFDWQNVIKRETKKREEYVFIEGHKPFLFLLFNKLQSLIAQAHSCQQTLRHMLQMAAPFNTQLKKKINNFDLVFFTMWFQGTIKSYPHNNIDPFFGKIPVLSKKNGLKTAIFCHIENFQSSNIKEFKNIFNQDIYSYFNILKIFDILSIWFKVLRGNSFFLGDYNHLKKCIKNDFLKTKWTQSIHALMIKCVVQKIIIKNPEIHIIHTYEGNCWEKGVMMATQNKSKNLSPTIIGYQHTSFSDFFQKLRASPFFFPNKILSTGHLASQILIKKFNYKKKLVVSTVSLRPSPFKESPVKQGLPKNFRNVLILLQGSPYDTLFLNEADRFLQNIPVNVTIRPHPNFYINIAELNKKFSFSTQKSLPDDLQSHDIVLHNGTTAALEAAYLGVPCVYIDLGFSFSSNPLDEVENNLLIHKGSKSGGFLKIVQKLIENSDAFPEHLSQFQEWYVSYFSTSTESKQDEFINIIMS